MHGRITGILVAALCLSTTATGHPEQSTPSTTAAAPIQTVPAITPAHHDEAIAELYAALRATRQAIRVTTTNLANAETIGYKAREVSFTENGGVVTPVTRFDIGTPHFSGGDFDLMIDGEGFFMVAHPEHTNTIGYTRAGNFFRNVDGELVLGTSRGPRLEPAIHIPEGVTNISFSQEGELSGVSPGSTTRTIFGQIQIASFIEPRSLKRTPGTLFIETPDSGPPIVDSPGENNLGTLMHRFNELSNVSPEIELAKLTSLNWRHEDLYKAIQILTQSRTNR